MRVHYENHVLNSTITVNSEDPAYPKSSLKDIHLSNKFRFIGKTSEFIDIDFGEAKAISSVGIISNLSSGATITLKGNSSASWTSPPVEETVAAAERNLLHYFTEASYRYWRLELADSGNSESYIEIESLYLGGYIQLPGIEPATDLPLKTASTVNVSATGQSFGVRRYTFQPFTIELPVITKTERDNLKTMWEVCENVLPVYLAIWEDDFEYQQPEYVRIDADEIGIQKLADMTFEAKIDFVQSF